MSGCLRRSAPLLLLTVTLACDVPDPTHTEAYVPAAVLCADGTSSLCSTMPAMIGPDPAIEVGVGYHGLSATVSGFDHDSQTPFDNMAWQMFVAVNWASSKTDQPPAVGLRGDGPVVWSEWQRPQDVFGGESSICPNPHALPRIAIISKSGGQPDHRMAEFLEASTNQPLIDVAGNWVVFERRLSPREQEYLEQQKLTSLAGQKVFTDQQGVVSFPAGGEGAGAVPGAIEIKSAWRVATSDPEWQGRFYLRPALLEVSADRVAGSDQPICASVTLALVGMHIVQKNPVKGALRDQWIWATFEHVDNAPLSSDPADPTDWKSYGKYAKSACPVDLAGTGSAGGYSLFDAACTECIVNAHPEKGADPEFLWQPEPPYAKRYLNQGRYGTQVVQCAQPYYLTEQLNQQWRQRLEAIDSVFANYTLIGTQWGASIEPTPGEFWRRAVPDFLSNTTMETYLQTDTFEFDQHGNMTQGPGSCVGCHGFATLAYPEGHGESRLASDFSFLPGLAERPCDDFEAGPIWSNQDAEETCPGLCSQRGLSWNGQWTTTEQGIQSVCGCCLAPGASP